MPRKSKEIEVDQNELNIRLMKAWSVFRKKVAEFVNNVEECSVDLHFESSLDSRTHYGFDPDEAIFISDIEVSNLNKVIFIVPHGSKNKSFDFTESELINAKYEGKKDKLMTFINDMYHESFKDVPEAGSITILERKYLAVDGELRGMLNNAEELIKKHELDIERGQTYSKLDQFGIF